MIQTLPCVLATKWLLLQEYNDANGVQFLAKAAVSHSLFKQKLITVLHVF